MRNTTQDINNIPGPFALSSSKGRPAYASTQPSSRLRRARQAGRKSDVASCVGGSARTGYLNAFNYVVFACLVSMVASVNAMNGPGIALDGPGIAFRVILLAAVAQPEPEVLQQNKQLYNDYTQVRKDKKLPKNYHRPQAKRAHAYDKKFIAARCNKK